MPNNVLLISEKGAPLNCNEVDNNYLALLNRANHTGVQPASSIFDLASAVMLVPGIQSIQTDLNTLRSTLQTLSNDVLGQSGYVATLVNNLRTTVQTDITNLTTNLQQTNLTITSLTAADTSLSNRINDLRNDLNEALQDLSILLSGLQNNTSTLIPTPPDDIGDLILTYDDSADRIRWRIPSVINCGPFIERAWAVGEDTRIVLGSFI